MRLVFRSLVGLTVAVVGASILEGASKEEDRLRESATVIKEILDIPDGIPQDLLDKAECIIVLPSVKKFALGIGGSYGKGALVCRGGDDFDGPWGAPAMVRLEGGNIGVQLGGQATDFLFLVMNPKGVDSLLKSKVKLGADASAAAGPKGRAAGASTDAAMRAEILTYSRSRGLFAGLSLEGSTLRPDDGANESLYRRTISAHAIVREGKASIPSAARELAAVLDRASPRNLSNQ
jgi:SH3 domain-containing YSC84-like protein 1